MNEIALPKLAFTLATNDVSVEGYFDAGSPLTFASYEWLQENYPPIPSSTLSIKMDLTTNRGSTTVEGVRTHIEIGFLDNSRRVTKTKINVFAIIDWNGSHFGKCSLPFLLGRDFLSEAGVSLEIFGSNSNLHATVSSWEALEIEVAAIFRSRGMVAKRDYNLAGHQIDVFLTEETKSGAKVSTIVECKDHKRRVGRRYITEMSSVFEFARNAKLAEHAVIVSSSGFSHRAQQAAATAGIELLHIEELRADAQGSYERTENIEQSEQDKLSRPKAAKIFVVMPFADEFLDFYMLGVREVANEFDYVCERVDEIEFNGSIRQKIIAALKDADVVVAELTQQNANVYYELGWAHALEKSVILCTRDIKSAPFDIQDLNHIVYGSVFELKERLRARLSSIVRIGPLPN